MRFRLRGQWRLGPIFINHTKYRPTSWGIKLGRFHRNFTRGTTSVDTPGPGALHFRNRRRRSR